MPQKYEAVRTAPAFVLIGKMRTDVAERERAEQRVRDGVRERVGVGMPDRTDRGLDQNAA